MNRLHRAAVLQIFFLLLPASITSLANDAEVLAEEHPPPRVDHPQDKQAAVAPPASTPYGMRELPGEILRDQKVIWLRPFRMHRKDAPWLAGLGGVTAALIATDRRVGQSLTESPPGAGYAFSNRSGQVGGGLTDLGLAGAFYLAGRWRGDENARLTGLQGFQALADSLIAVEVLKIATQRPRPARLGGRERIHNADGQFFTGGNSFPSGHAMEAWSLATVVAQRYRHRPWVPVIAYGLAGLDGAARITDRRHFPSDVFVGSVVGYLIGRYVAQQRSSGLPGSMARLRVQPSRPARGGSAIEISWQF